MSVRLRTKCLWGGFESHCSHLTLVLFELQKRQYIISSLRPFTNIKAICYPQKASKSKWWKICWCKICNNKNNHPESGLTCCYYKYVTHEKCAICKAANKFICCECQSDMFLFTNIQDHDMLDLTFKSNSQNICLEN